MCPLSSITSRGSLVPNSLSVLFVEDDAVLGKAVQRGLTELGHKCTWAKTGDNGLFLAINQAFDAIVLDRMLPSTDGMQVLKSIRGHGIRVPVLILTALGGVEDRVGGLNAGADDYLVKPFEFPELIARLKAICRRSASPNPTVLTAGPLTLDLTTRKVSRDQCELELTQKEFSLLELLMRNVGQVVTRKMFCEHLWESDWEGMTNVVEVHVSRLRNKVDKGFNVKLLHTIRGYGYILRIGDDANS